MSASGVLGIIPKFIFMKNEKHEANLLTIDELSEYLKLSKETIYRRIYDKTLPCFKVGRVWRFKSKEIEKWLAKQKQVQ